MAYSSGIILNGTSEECGGPDPEGGTEGSARLDLLSCTGRGCSGTQASQGLWAFVLTHAGSPLPWGGGAGLKGSGFL